MRDISAEVLHVADQAAEGVTSGSEVGNIVELWRQKK
jgi:hypothetical protein